MNRNVDILEEKIENISVEDMIFIDDIISENKIIINMPLIDVVGNDLTRAAMLTRYMFFYKHNNYQAFSQSDKQISDFLRTNIKTIERQKRWLKENGFISVKKIGIPAVGFITVNVQKIRERYKCAESSTLKMRELEPLKRGDIYNNIEERNIRDNIKENIKRKTDPASGTPSSPEVDELQVYDLQFESFWDKVQYKAQKSKAYAQWKKATNNGKSLTAIKGIEEGYERYVSFLAKTKKLGFNQSHMLMSRFLNHKDQIWLEDWKTEEEQRQERNKEQQKRFFETKQREEQKQKEQQRNELEEEKRQHLIAITTKYRKYWSDVIKQRFGFDVTTDDIEQHKTDNTDYWIYFEEWCQGRYIADTIGVFTKKGMDYDAIEECFDKRIKTKNTKKTSYRP